MKQDDVCTQNPDLLLIDSSSLWQYTLKPFSHTRFDTRRFITDNENRLLQAHPPADSLKKSQFKNGQPTENTDQQQYQ